MDSQFSEFRQKFVEDATVLIDELELNAMQLEESPESHELIESIFRCMHTLKGVSSMYGYNSIAEITHEMEDLYDFVRDGQLKIDSDIIQLTLNTADYIRNTLQAEDENNEMNSIYLEKIITTIQSILNLWGLNKKQKKIEKKKKQEDKIFSTWQITFAPEESIINQNINLLGTFRDLFALGSYNIIQAEAFSEKNKFNIFLYTDKSREDIEDSLFFIVDYCKITKIAEFDIFDNQALDEHKIIERKPAKTKKEELKISALQTEYNEIKEVQEVPVQQKEAELPAANVEIHQQIAELDLEHDSVEQKHKEHSRSRISVESAKLDELLYLVTELITSNSQLVIAAKDKIYNPLRPILENIDKLSKLFRNNTLSLRLVPINEMVIKFQRLVRDLSKNLGKEVELLTQGTETELDKNTIDALSDPLMHLIRNSIDHGIEAPEIRCSKNKPIKGVIKIAAFHSGNFVFIQISDDGQGIDIQKIKQKAIEKKIISQETVLTDKEAYDMIFLPGFSTAESLTQVSGRGVGMDVVKNKLKELRGQIEVTSEKDLGTSITIKLHQTIAILDTMLFQLHDVFFMVPLADVIECQIISIHELEKRKYTQTISYAKKLIPYIDLYSMFHLETSASKRLKLIILNRQETFFAIAADSIVGEHQAVLKSIGEAAKMQPYITLASVLGNGKLAYLLDMNTIQSLILTHNN